eukprot:gene17742-21158_t
MKALIEADIKLQRTLKQMEQHLIYQKEIVAIQKEIEEKDAVIASLAANLKSLETVLEQEISEVTTKNEQLKEELISYAHKISGTTSAPYGYRTDLALMPLYKPPAPQEEMMRASNLFIKLPLNLLQFYGLADVDLSTPTPLPGGVKSPISDEDGGSDQQPNLHQSMDQQQQQQSAMDTGTKLLVPISTPPLKNPQAMMANIDLDLNPDLEDDDESESDDSESGDDSDDSGNGEVDWD